MGILYFSKSVYFSIWIFTILLGWRGDREILVSTYDNCEEISMEIDSYMTRFTELYTSGVMDGNDYINIEEREIYLEDGSTIATLRIYTDLENRCLRYKVNMYGETMQSILNYYFCDNFVLISRQNDYYSSWILSETVENDILYSNIYKWIIMDGVSYIWQDNGELKETDTNLIPVPSVEEIEEAIKQAD